VPTIVLVDPLDGVDDLGIPDAAVGRTGEGAHLAVAGRFGGRAVQQPGVLTPAVGAFETVFQVDASQGRGQFSQVGGGCAEQAGELAEAPVGEWHGLAIRCGQQDLAILVVVDGERVQADVDSA
jgi:hypothetical protein